MIQYLFYYFLDSNFVLGNAAAPPDYPIVYCSDGFCSLTGRTDLFLPVFTAHGGPMFAFKFAIILPLCSRNAQSRNNAATLRMSLALVRIPRKFRHSSDVSKYEDLISMTHLMVIYGCQK